MEFVVHLSKQKGFEVLDFNLILKIIQSEINENNYSFFNQYFNCG